MMVTDVSNWGTPLGTEVRVQCWLLTERAAQLAVRSGSRGWAADLCALRDAGRACQGPASGSAS